MTKITCACGFIDYCTDESWSIRGVWSFKWWNGTGGDEPCVCPRCNKELPWLNLLESGDFGILVIDKEIPL